MNNGFYQTVGTNPDPRLSRDRGYAQVYEEIMNLIRIGSCSKTPVSLIPLFRYSNSYAYMKMKPSGGSLIIIFWYVWVWSMR